jgi:hypothetical protein
MRTFLQSKGGQVQQCLTQGGGQPLKKFTNFFDTWCWPANLGGGVYLMGVLVCIESTGSLQGVQYM